MQRAVGPMIERTKRGEWNVSATRTHIGARPRGGKGYESVSPLVRLSSNEDFG